jgi:type IV pilus assembly protein PilM
MKWSVPFLQAKTRLLGIEVTDTAIYAVELVHNKQNFILSNYAQVALAMPTDSAMCSTALQQLVTGMQTRQAVMAVCHDEVMVKTISVAADLTASEIAKHIFSQAQHYFSYPADELRIDYEILHQHNDTLEIKCVASKRKHVAAYVELLQQAGLQPLAIDVDYLALRRAYPLLIKSKDMAQLVLFAHITQHSVLINIMQYGKAIYTSNETIDALAAITRALQFVQGSVQLIILSGDIKHNLLAEIQQVTHIATEPAYPHGLQIASDINIHALAPSLLLCCGLAMWKKG